MKLLKNISAILTFFFSISQIHAQVLEGNVYDMATNQPLQAATVYLDGTTISGATNGEGYFKINGNGNTQATLVVSYVGYKTIRLNNPFQNKKVKVLMEEDAISMQEVVLSKGPFTRKSMMKAFKQQFLGITEAGISCKIENEEDINLYYDIETNTLSATSQKPIKIKNPYLGYEIFFELMDFNVVYKHRSLLTYDIEKSYFAGTTFYKDITRSPKKANKKRLEAYLGSSSHFMNTVANESWKEQKTALFVDKFMVDPKLYFKVGDTLGMKKVTVIKEPIKKTPIYKKESSGKDFNGHLKFEVSGYKDENTHFSVLYDGQKQSIVQFVEKVFVVDENGNYNPLYGVMYGGYLGTLKVGDMLPTDYYQTIKGKY
jgi:CarboxypepD_reg-like domain